VRGVSIKFKKRNRYFIISLIISILLLVVFIYVVFNFRTVFGVGIFNAEDNYINSYSDGTAGVNLHIRLEREREISYYLYTEIDTISTGNVVNYGILSTSIFYLNDNHFVNVRIHEFDVPLRSYAVSRLYVTVDKNNNLTCNGVIELSLKTGGIPINDTVNFQLSYIIPYGLDFYMDLNLALYVLFFLPFILLFIIPIVLNWIFAPVFGLKYSEEDVKRDEKYYQYLKQKRREEGH